MTVDVAFEREYGRESRERGSVLSQRVFVFVFVFVFVLVIQHCIVGADHSSLISSTVGSTVLYSSILIVLLPYSRRSSI
jgi:hypothetical protein